MFGNIYEQSGRIRELGVGINLLPHAVKELAEVGLLDKLDEVAIQTAELTYAHRLGQPILRRQCGLAAGFAVPQFSIHRGPAAVGPLRGGGRAPRRGRGAHGAAAGLRKGGPEGVIDRVEELAPDGFTRLEDVIDPAELEAIVTGYAKASGVTRAPQLDGP